MLGTLSGPSLGQREPVHQYSATSARDQKMKRIEQHKKVAAQAKCGAKQKTENGARRGSSHDGGAATTAVCSGGGRTEEARAWTKAKSGGDGRWRRRRIGGGECRRLTGKGGVAMTTDARRGAMATTIMGKGKVATTTGGKC